MESDKGMRLDAHAEQLTILAGAREIGNDESLSAALVALYECHSRWGDVDIEGFFVWVLEIRSVVAEELTACKSEASCTSDLKRGETVDVRRGHRLYIITPTHERRIERAAVVCEVEIFDGGFAAEVIIWGHEFFTFGFTKTRADFECHAI
jgi:hypothetical protein